MLDPNKVNKKIPVPLYYQLKSLILEEIKNGTLKKDELLPTEAELGEIFEISRTTIRQAISELVNEGWLYRIRSKGTFVSHPKVNQNSIQKLESYNNEMLRLGKVPSTKVLKIEVMKPIGHMADDMGISFEEDVIYIRRVRYADERPIVEVKTYLPYNCCKFVLDHDLSKESLHSTLGLHKETALVSVERRLEAMSANEDDCKLLDMKKGNPILFLKSIGRNEDGKVMEVSICRYRGDSSSFEFVVSI